jgi:hypothetical protein
MIAAHPETRGVLEMVERLEKNITDLEELLLKTVAGAEKSEFSSWHFPSLYSFKQFSSSSQ